MESDRAVLTGCVHGSEEEEQHEVKEGRETGRTTRAGQRRLHDAETQSGPRWRYLWPVAVSAAPPTGLLVLHHVARGDERSRASPSDERLGPATQQKARLTVRGKVRVGAS